MGNRGIQPKGKVKIKWSPDFSYAIGLIATDGCLSTNGRHVIFVSKDIDQVKNFKKILKLDSKIGNNYSGTGNLSYRVQFGDVLFCDFLRNIGIFENKSKTIGILKIPHMYFFDFLRGSFDGDGTFYSYWDKRWKSSFMFYTEFISASKKHIDWIREEVFLKIKISGHITKAKNNSCYQLKYAKRESQILLRKLYYKKNLICLSRKRLKIKKILGSIVK
jgi:hypothetical protein